MDEMPAATRVAASLLSSPGELVCNIAKTPHSCFNLQVSMCNKRKLLHKSEQLKNYTQYQSKWSTARKFQLLSTTCKQVSTAINNLQTSFNYYQQLANKFQLLSTTRKQVSTFINNSKNSNEKQTRSLLCRQRLETSECMLHWEAYLNETQRKTCCIQLNMLFNIQLFINEQGA